MKNTEYAGIDYGRLDGTNRNKTTGIHYGVIHQNSISGDALDDLEPDYGEPHCPKCGNELVASDSDTLPEDAEWNTGKDYACEHCKCCFWSDQVWDCCEPLGHTFDRDGYKIHGCQDGDLFVIESPYYSHSQFCSPCAPGAGYLENPCKDGPKTYCLGHDWFEGGKAPYPVYSVATGKRVYARK